MMRCRFCGYSLSNSLTNLKKSDLITIFDSLYRIECPLECFQVSFMGQGEPLMNLYEIYSFATWILGKYNSPVIGISTVGMPKGLLQLGKVYKIPNLKVQVSLHSAIQAKRDYLMPISRIISLKELRFSLLRFNNDRPDTTLCLNYLLLDGINDGFEDANALVEFLRGIQCNVKLSYYNPVVTKTKFKPSKDRRFIEFAYMLASEGIACKIFRSIGSDISTGCGQTRLFNQVEYDECSDIEREKAIRI